jgi:threonine/homoserine/homoserine lactone efflux protein
MSFDQWLIFVAIWTAASLPLGPNALNCISASAGNGFRRSLWSVAGTVLAAICHMASTILGVATILLANATLFQGLKLLGAAYLIWMGLALWRSKHATFPVARRPSAGAVELVRRGFLISMSNPKAILSYMAVFSQFLEPGAALAGRLAVLVPTALAIVIGVYAGYCALGLGIGRWISTARRRMNFNRGVGSVYLMAGIGLAVSEPSSAVPLGAGELRD